MERIAVIGSGRIGRAWAIVFARAGHSVTLYDPAPGATDAALGLLREALEEMLGFGLLDEAPDTVARRVTGSAALADAVRDADYVQENAPEDLKVKRELTRHLDQAAPPHCILASSTSTFKCSQISEGLPGKHRCIVAHPVNPPHVVPVVEIAPAPWTRETVTSRTRALLRSVGQRPITLKREVEGFVLNRLQASLLREAWRLVKDGVVSVEDLDACVKDGLGLRWSFMGPFETIDLNAPGGVTGYAERYGPVFHDLLKDVTYSPWDDALIARVAEERRAQLAPEKHAEREAWRDRRLMALIAHKRETERKDAPWPSREKSSSPAP